MGQQRPQQSMEGSLMYMPWLLEFMYPTHHYAPKVIVVSDKRYKRDKERAVAAEIKLSIRRTDAHLSSIKDYKEHLTKEMTKITIKEEELLGFKKNLEDKIGAESDTDEIPFSVGNP